MRSLQNFVDRNTMHLFYDKLYTTRERRPPLKALVVLTDLKVEDLPTVLSQREKLSRVYYLNVAPLGEALYRVTFQRTLGLTEIKRDVIIDSGNEGAWVIYTDAESYFVTHVLERFFDGLYPMVSRVYLNYSQMRRLLRRIKESYQGETAATFFVLKRERQEQLKERGIIRRKGTEILWERDVDEDVQRLVREGFVVKVARLDFEVRDKDNMILLQAHLTRKSLCKLRFGSFSAFYKNVIVEAIGFSLERRNFYDKRERSIDKGTIKLRPLQVQYPFAFQKEQLDDFARRLTSTYSSSIVHGGNPYFFANLCDYEDGSSFSIVVLGDIVTITPFTRATPQAVWRLLNKIQDVFGDGEVADVEMR